MYKAQSALFAPTKTASRSQAAAAAVESWGRFPLLCFSNSLALILIALAYTANRDNLDWGAAVYWVSLLIIFIPTALRLVRPNISRKERIGLIVLLGCSLYLVKVLHSPLDFTFYDEFLHWQTANHILQSGHLFTENSLLPVSPLYPGLEVLTTAFVNLSGLSVVTCGVIMLGIARVVLMLALFLFYERISHSAQIGGLATLLYTANSNFIFFDSQFSYESLSLPIAMTVIYIVASQTHEEREERHFLTHLALIVPLIFLIVLTHHLTGFVVAGFLSIWTVAALIRNRKETTWLRLA